MPLQLRDVYDNKAVLLTWYTGLETFIQIHYTAPDGKPRVVLDPDPVFRANWESWGFHLANPWFERLDECITRIIESGLIDQWKVRTWDRMKTEAKGGEAELFANVEETATLNLEHFLGTFLLYGAVVVVAIISLVAEVGYFYCTRAA